MEKNWQPISQTPPDTLVWVKDKDGNEAQAYPTYYHFDVVKMPGDERKPWGWRGTIVYHENFEQKWDGGWLISCKGMDIPELGTIEFWAIIESIHGCSCYGRSHYCSVNS